MLQWLAQIHMYTQPETLQIQCEIKVYFLFINQRTAVFQEQFDATLDFRDNGDLA